MLSPFPFLSAFLMLIIGIRHAQGAPSTDVLLVERPTRLVILNQYQQQATDKERGSLESFHPFILVDERAMLSDGFTRCMKVTIDGSTYFLQTTGANELMNASDLGTTLVVRGVALEHDTVASTRSVIDVDLLKGLRKSFPPGTPFVKLFRVGNRLCIRSVETGDVGWIPASRSFSFTKYGNVLVSPSTTHAHVLDIVTQKIAESNTIWRAIYQELNRESGRGLPPPSWTATEMPNSIVCDLLHPPGQGGARGSNRYLAIDLENRLLGSQCRVISTNDRIIIQYP